VSTIECRHESDVLDEIGAGRWPEAAPAELKAHVAACVVCGDLALAASALHDDAPAAAPMALPSAGQVWWRAELRSRHEAAHLAQRPILAVQVVAAVVAVLGLVAGLRTVAPNAWAWLVEAIGHARTAGTSGLDSWTVALILGAGFWLVVAPVAIYLVLRSDRITDRQAGR
jgi:hypothetical protein